MTHNRFLTTDTFFKGRIQVKQNKYGYRFSIDAALLAYHAKPRPGDRVLDLGTGCGIIPLILAYQNPEIHVYGIEVQESLSEIAALNVEENHMGDQISKMFRVQYKLRQNLGRDPENAEVAEAVGITLEKVEYLLRIARHPLSLELPTVFEDDSVLGDFIEDIESPAPPQMAETSLLRQDLVDVLEVLPAREVRILQLRYGLADGRRHTLQEVGDKMGVSRERVRQIESQALSRLRNPSVCQKLRGYLGSL